MKEISYANLVSLLLILCVNTQRLEAKEGLMRVSPDLEVKTLQLPRIRDVVLSHSYTSMRESLVCWCEVPNIDLCSQAKFHVCMAEILELLLLGEAI